MSESAPSAVERSKRAPASALLFMSGDAYRKHLLGGNHNDTAHYHGLAAMLIATGFVLPAFAMSATSQSSKYVWSAMDKCVKDAREKYPDDTADALAKRDAFTHTCQRNNRVPVREGQSPKK